MKTLKPRKENIFGVMIEGYGVTKTKGGLMVMEHNMTDGAIRPRWFHVTAIGPDQNDVSVGDYVLVEHARWSRKITVDFGQDGDLYHIDEKEILLVTDRNPLE